MAEPPSTFSRASLGVCTLSKAIDPTTTNDMGIRSFFKSEKQALSMFAFALQGQAWQPDLEQNWGLFYNASTRLAGLLKLIG